ncbi:MAG: hypothetical protein M3Q16_07665 [Pseudomonadota bacterium]|nr:hypothetical protein [Pseudomonadota bacterium]
MDFQTTLKGRTVQTLALVGALALAGSGHAQSSGSGDRDSAGSSSSTSGQSSQKPKKDYDQSEGVKGEAKEKIDRGAERDIKLDKEHKLDPSQHNK